MKTPNISLIKDKNSFKKERKCLKKQREWNITDSYKGPSTKMIKMDNWKTVDNINDSSNFIINNALLMPGFINQISKTWSKKAAFHSNHFVLKNDPFQVATVANLLENSDIITNLMDEIVTTGFERREMDLYELYQSTDLSNIQSGYLSGFYKFLNNTISPWIENITGMKFAKVSASCSVYNKGDYLLAHDDLLTDRLIAFVYYITPWKKQWTNEMGGALELFEANSKCLPYFPIKSKILPANNQLVFFKVNSKSYHQVGEILSMESPRITINGWFHGNDNNTECERIDAKRNSIRSISFVAPLNNEINLSKYISKSYLKDSIKLSIQKQIEENSETALVDFFQLDFYENLLNELKNLKESNWSKVGPANIQNYDVCQPNCSSDVIQSMLALIKSNLFFKLLHEYTELDLYGKGKKDPKVTVELQRWSGGCYTVLGDSSEYKKSTLDLLVFFGDNIKYGVTSYLNANKEENLSNDEESIESEDEQDDPVLLTVHPNVNVLNIVYRSEGTAKFVKYCPFSCYGDCNYILSCSYTE